MNGGTRAMACRVAKSRPAEEASYSAVPGGQYRLPQALAALMLLLSLVGCLGPNSHDSRFTFRLVTGTENRSLVPLLEQFAEQEDVKIEFTHQGSVDTMLELQSGAASYDAVWPASSIWLTLGDTQRVVQQ